MKKNRKSRMVDYLTVYFMTKMSDSYKSKVRRAYRLASDLYRSLDKEKKETLYIFVKEMEEKQKIESLELFDKRTGEFIGRKSI
jgi:hypothetical protein